MEGGIMFEALLQNQSLSFSSDGFDSPWVPNSFHDEKTNRKKSDSGQHEKEYNSDEDCFRQPEKKRRLSVDQVQCLEKSFKEENKLEPERKNQLAKELDLQPRQVAIWFQNRRARCKTKQLEKDYDALNSTYDKLKLEFDCLQKHNDKLKQQVETLKQKLYNQREIQIGEKDSILSSKELADLNKVSLETWTNEPKMVICKQEYANSVSTKSTDSYSSPPDGHGNYSPFLEPCDSSNVFENQSDFSQDEEDNLSILRCPKIEYESYIEDPNHEGSNLVMYPINDQPFWLWP